MTTPDPCWLAAKLLPFDPDWTRLRDLCAQMTKDGVQPSAVELARAYVELIATVTPKK
jgi:hypothetical protein